MISEKVEKGHFANQAPDMSLSCSKHFQLFQ